MLGLTVDMRQESLFLPFQTQLLKKEKKNKITETNGIKNILLVLNKSHFILNRMTSL